MKINSEARVGKVGTEMEELTLQAFLKNIYVTNTLAYNRHYLSLSPHRALGCAFVSSMPGYQILDLGESDRQWQTR